MPEQDEIDLLIDSALRDYAEPLSGLEQRMVARISPHELSSRRRWLFVAIAAPAVAALILLLAYLVPWTLHPNPDQMAHAPSVPAVAPVITTTPKSAARDVVPSHHLRHQDRSGNRALSNLTSRPKLDVFPTPQPLNSEEEALTRFATEASEADRRALVEAKQRVDEPLNISAIRIPPLQSPEDNQN